MAGGNVWVGEYRDLSVVSCEDEKCPKIVGVDGGGTCVGQIRVVVGVVVPLLLSMSAGWG